MNLLTDLSWLEIKEYLKRDNRVILPLGAMEEHGPHLGVGVDSFEAEAIANGACEASGVIAAPVMNYGMAASMMGFPGTLTLRPRTLMAVIEDILQGLYQHGFRRVLIVNGHGGNSASIKNSVQTVAAELQMLRVKFFEWWTDAEAYQHVLDVTGEQDGSHASLGETSFMMAIRPNAVKLKYLTGRDAPIQPSREITTVLNCHELYPDGIMGYDPRNATPEAGEAMLRKFVGICVKELDNW